MYIPHAYKNKYLLIYKPPILPLITVASGVTLASLSLPQVSGWVREQLEWRMRRGRPCRSGKVRPRVTYVSVLPRKVLKGLKPICCGHSFTFQCCTSSWIYYICFFVLYPMRLKSSLSDGIWPHNSTCVMLPILRQLIYAVNWLHYTHAYMH